MISFGERCYSNQYDEFSYDEISDDEISGDKFPPPKKRDLEKLFSYVCS